ncbi:hypothetical protein GGTG_13313 [Gaeumannomyces tritici R3-111a-1]|uniref:Uncharacterized protein n=1 Tax=Gaeumannomyces tritici (strain R3-111a-1) TaxID=644352 RepID=J3PII5_GAET3|nr:hypothetical protein GGTG_13313 [Gaeumannomyces tritici R3-111a-1]EJT69204.1 hypothetical protein GGTG_13313 [Gaeumannomyces tritici R3-111a-1]
MLPPKSRERSSLKAEDPDAQLQVKPPGWIYSIITLLCCCPAEDLSELPPRRIVSINYQQPKSLIQVTTEITLEWEDAKPSDEPSDEPSDKPSFNTSISSQGAAHFDEAAEEESNADALSPLLPKQLATTER